MKNTIFIHFESCLNFCKKKNYYFSRNWVSFLLKGNEEKSFFNVLNNVVKLMYIGIFYFSALGLNSFLKKTVFHPECEAFVSLLLRLHFERRSFHTISHGFILSFLPHFESYICVVVKGNFTWEAIWRVL